MTFGFSSILSQAFLNAFIVIIRNWLVVTFPSAVIRTCCYSEILLASIFALRPSQIFFLLFGRAVIRKFY